MEHQSFEEKMENLKKPDVSGVQHQEVLKMTLFNARKSAALGLWFVLIPCYFLFCVFMKYYFRANLHLFDIAEEFFAQLDKNPNTHFLSPILFVVLPITGIIVNALSILHFEYRKGTRVLVVTIQLRWANIGLLLVSSAIVLIFLLYAVTENYNH